MTQSTSCSRSLARCRMRAASGAASDQRPEYFTAWMISRRVPSYSPMARARVTIDDWLAQLSHPAPMRDRGSPHRSHIGGVIGKTERQHVPHTQPDNGSSSNTPHTAHDGANNAVKRALPIPEIRDWGFGIRAITLSRVLLIQPNVRSRKELIGVMRHHVATRMPARNLRLCARCSEIAEIIADQPWGDDRKNCARERVTP